MKLRRRIIVLPQPNIKQKLLKLYILSICSNLTTWFIPFIAGAGVVSSYYIKNVESFIFFFFLSLIPLIFEMKFDTEEYKKRKGDK